MKSAALPTDHVSKYYAHFGGMCWPRACGNPMSDLEYTLRYDEPTREDLLVAASVIEAYRHIVIGLDSRDRARIVATLRTVEGLGKDQR